MQERHDARTVRRADEHAHAGVEPDDVADISRSHLRLLCPNKPNSTNPAATSTCDNWVCVGKPITGLSLFRPLDQVEQFDEDRKSVIPYGDAPLRITPPAVSSSRPAAPPRPSASRAPCRAASPAGRPCRVGGSRPCARPPLSCPPPAAPAPWRANARVPCS